MNQLVDGIKQKYKASIDINDELSDIKLSLNQLLGIKLDLNSSDQQSLETIKNIVLHVVEVQEKLSTDYFANYNAAREELVNIREQTALLIQSSSCDETLKMYNQRLIFFANKFRNEAEEINKNINEAEVFYKEMHYLESMNILMQLLDRVKMSAKIKKINF
jgi:septation ring formation regulator EzrA